jgi:hypothetical protein
MGGAGAHNLHLRWLSGQLFLPEFAQGVAAMSSTNQPSLRSAELGHQSHHVLEKSSWQVSPGVLWFSAESINGMDLVALSTLHQLLEGNTLNM